MAVQWSLVVSLKFARSVLTKFEYMVPKHELMMSALFGTDIYHDFWVEKLKLKGCKRHIPLECQKIVWLIALAMESGVDA